MAVLPNHRNHGGGSLSELVLILLYFRNVPIESDSAILDIDTDSSNSVSDSDVKAF